MASPGTISRIFVSRNDALARPIRLPALGYLYRTINHPHARHASTSKRTPPTKSKTLEKPDKFRPPSHPARLVKSAPIRQYGPAPTEAQKKDYQTKQYPHMPPPKGSFMDKFLNNRALHTTIALSVLTFFAGWTLLLNFKATSPYAGQMPGFGDWFQHPIDSFGQAWNTTKLHVLHESAVTQEKRRRMIDETMKTKAYRVMHGYEPLKGQPTEVQILVAKMKGEYVDGQETPLVDPPEPPKKRPVKKWLGIWE